MVALKGLSLLEDLHELDFGLEEAAVPLTSSSR